MPQHSRDAMTSLTHDVLTKLKFWYPKPVTGQTLAEALRVNIRQIQSAIEELRTTADEKGRRYFVVGGMGEDDKGYRLTEDITEMRECVESYKRRAKTYFVNSQGMDAAMKYHMDEQGITGTLFERAG